MEFTIYDAVGLLFNLVVIVFSWILILKNYNSFKKLNIKELENNRNIITDFAIGISSGLVVFVLGWFANNMNFPKMNFNSIIEFLYSVFTGLISLIFQVSIIFALISWIIKITFKDSNQKKSY